MWRSHRWHSDLVAWSLSKAWNGWRQNRVCLDRVTSDPMPEPHEGCVQAQKAHDLLSSARRYNDEEVIGWLITDEAVDSDLW